MVRWHNNTGGHELVFYSLLLSKHLKPILLVVVTHSLRRLKLDLTKLQMVLDLLMDLALS